MLIKKQLHTGQHEQLIDITAEIRLEIRKNGIKFGILTVFVPHTTAGVTINENADPDVRTDILSGLKKIGLENASYRHSEGNSPSHIKASVVGAGQTIIIENGEPLLGIWQGVYFAEFDGPRNRNYFLKFIEQ